MLKTNYLIKLNDISKVYNLGNIHISALKNIDLRIEKGEFVAIKGPSGSGKSTLLNLIGCLDHPTSGKYCLEGQRVDSFGDEELAQIRKLQIGFVFQTFNLLPRMNALKNTELPMVYARVPAPERRMRALKIIESVELKGRIMHLPSELSGGEKQRIAICRALVNDPKIILADEPTGNLDSESGQQIMSIFKDLNKKGITVLLVTHEAEIAGFAHRTVLMKDGQIVSR